MSHPGNYLTTSDLTYLEIDAEHHWERVKPEQVRYLIAEVFAWRELGGSPDSVSDRLEELQDEMTDLQEALDAAEEE